MEAGLITEAGHHNWTQFWWLRMDPTNLERKTELHNTYILSQTTTTSSSKPTPNFPFAKSKKNHPKTSPNLKARIRKSGTWDLKLDSQKLKLRKHLHSKLTTANQNPDFYPTLILLYLPIEERWTKPHLFNNHKWQIYLHQFQTKQLRTHYNPKELQTALHHKNSPRPVYPPIQ